MNRGGMARTFAIAAFALAVALTTTRTITALNVEGHPELTRYGLRDFRDAFYYSTVAFVRGENPYEASSYIARYPVGNSFPLYSPIALLVHLPFAFLPHGPAQWLHYLLNLALTLGVAALALRACGRSPTAPWVFGVAAVLVVSRPGHMTLFLGQCTMFVVAGTYLALTFARTRPWIASLGLALACLKPTYGVPLAILMLCRGDVRASAGGIAIAVALSLACMPRLLSAAGGLGPFLSSLAESQSAFASDPEVRAGGSLYRVDAATLLGRLLGNAPGLEPVVTLLILALTGWAVWRLQSREEHDRFRLLSASLICVAVLVCTYHQAYDGVLLTLPILALLLSLEIRGRAVALLAMAVPTVNYLSTESAINMLSLGRGGQAAVAALSAAALLIAFGLFTAAARDRVR